MDCDFGVGSDDPLGHCDVPLDGLLKRNHTTPTEVTETETGIWFCFKVPRPGLAALPGLV